MEMFMASNPSETDALIRRMVDGDEEALIELFGRYYDRLRRMVKLRMDRRLQGRLDPSDVLQEAYFDVARRAQEYRAIPTMPVFLWLRWITGQRLMVLHRKHLGAQMRNAGLEVSLHGGALPPASSISIAAMLPGRITSPHVPPAAPSCRFAFKTCSIPWTRSIAKF
jgi:RNA polymerase sigma-70 factor, ECF subfamily